jgi:hypothetical protein
MVSFSKWFNRVVLRREEITVRARNKQGKYKADDPTTPDRNEAYTTKTVKRRRK